MTESQINEFKGDYILLDKQSLSATDYANDLKTYPQLANIDIYKLNTTNKKEIAQLNTILSKAIPPVLAIEQNGLAAYAGTCTNTCWCRPVCCDCTTSARPACSA